MTDRNDNPISRLAANLQVCNDETTARVAIARAYVESLKNANIERMDSSSVETLVI